MDAHVCGLVESKLKKLTTQVGCSSWQNDEWAIGVTYVCDRDCMGLGLFLRCVLAAGLPAQPGPLAG